MAPKGTLTAQSPRPAGPRNDPRATAVQRASSTPIPGAAGQGMPPSTPTNVHPPQQPSIRVTQSSQHSTPTLGVTNTESPYFPGQAPGQIGPLPSTAPPNIQQHPAMANRGPHSNSTVMQDTLGVIDEHITDMRQSGRSVSPRARRATTDSASEYSVPMASDTHSQISYIQGEETEEEESGRLTAKEVKKWGPDRMATYLESVGVEKSHCDVFREQEFSGEVMLGMDQSSIFLKELDLGPIGRRLRTWQKIRALQDEVSPPKPSQTRKVSESSRPGSRRASNSTTAVLQRAPNSLERLPAPNLVERFPEREDFPAPAQPQSYSPSHPGRQESNTGSALSRISASASASPRPSAANVRNLGHQRRQSSIDQTLNTNSATGTPQMSQASHTKQSSFDRNWNMSNVSGQPNGSTRPVTSSHSHSLSSGRTDFEKRASQLSLNTQTTTTAPDTDHGYQSAAEGDRPARRVLRKRENEHSRASSYEGGNNRFSFFRRSRASSMTRTPPISGPSSAMHVSSGADIGKDKNRLSGAPSEAATTTSGPSAVTALETQEGQTEKDTPKSSRKGLRAISDAVTGREKAASHLPPVEQMSPTTDISTPHSPSSGTPSANSRSLDIDDANTGPHSTPVGPPSAKRRKNKKETSAYMRGLEKKSPQEQMIGAEWSGWMKKKSSNLVTNWKPRLFVLKGKRLSYYYSETDTQERGLIDITGHRVLPADKERLTGLHASITKATSSPTSPQIVNSASFAPTTSASPTTISKEDDANSSILTTPVSATGIGSKEFASDGQGFIFKLVPPRAGMSRAVNFTKPTVHYFAVPSIEVGRLWMAALMKATIDRDEGTQVQTTYQQKTISLEKARARKERPPALKNEEIDEHPTVGGASEDGSVLEKVDEAVDAEEEEGEATEGFAEPEKPMQSQMREVTDLSPITGNRGSASPKHEKKSSRSSTTGRKRSESADGLGIQGLNGEKGSPNLLGKIHKAGLW
ncbi:MAG: hypothetical protein Q9162_004525 [Coniocarpon cinnabarinum]